MDLLEIYKKSFDKRGDEGLATGLGNPPSYLGNNPGPIPPVPSPLKAEYLEKRENQSENGTSIDGGTTNDPASGFTQIYKGTTLPTISTSGYFTSNIIGSTDG